MRYKGVIFDLDGVICHTDKYHYYAWKELADSLGIYFDEIINNRFRGVSREKCMEILLEGYNNTISDTEKTMLAEKKNDLYRELLKNLSSKDLDFDIKETLDKLKEKGISLAIGSSSKNTMFILGQLGIKDYFNAVSDGNNISKSKPNPEVFLKAAAFMGLSPKECLVVEDAKAGIEAANRGGFDSAGIGEAALHESITYPINKFKDILNII
ncbi:MULTISPECIES: beta-phosphoglucomutase [unclassified Clostridium]|uniref:beta-phosphoglucomutase n=1 Tax=unclassified Clostridium TaxID=2614128 RepID=UPI001EEE55B2|nr:MULTISPECIES: beta-phosphoglucomutase [unclassified Clostridium]